MVLARRTITALTLAAGMLAGAVAPGCTTPTEGVARGEFLYKNCVQCHGADGMGSDLVKAPQIAGLPAWYITAQVQKFRGGMRGAHAEDVAGLKMRPMARTIKTVEDVKFVAEYVAAMPHGKAPATVQGDATKGKDAFATCSACHGQDGAGNEALQAPPIRQLNDWYVVAQLGKFKTGVRGYAPEDTQGAQMRGIAGGIADEAAMRDLAAYIQTLPAQ